MESTEAPVHLPREEQTCRTTEQKAPERNPEIAQKQPPTADRPKADVLATPPHKQVAASSTVAALDRQANHNIEESTSATTAPTAITITALDLQTIAKQATHSTDEKVHGSGSGEGQWSTSATTAPTAITVTALDLQTIAKQATNSTEEKVHGSGSGEGQWSGEKPPRELP
jgi:hypothetical protein